MRKMYLAAIGVLGLIAILMLGRVVQLIDEKESAQDETTNTTAILKLCEADRDLYRQELLACQKGAP